MSSRSTPSALPLTEADLAALPPLIMTHRLWTDWRGPGLLPISREMGMRQIAAGGIPVVPVGDRSAVTKSVLLGLLTHGIPPLKKRRRRTGKTKAGKGRKRGPQAQAKAKAARPGRLREVATASVP